MYLRNCAAMLYQGKELFGEVDIRDIWLIIIPMLYYTKALKLPVPIPREQS